MYKCECGNDTGFVLTEEFPRTWYVEQKDDQLLAYGDGTIFEGGDGKFTCQECGKEIDIDWNEVKF